MEAKLGAWREVADAQADPGGWHGDPARCRLAALTADQQIPRDIWPFAHRRRRGRHLRHYAQRSACPRTTTRSCSSPVERLRRGEPRRYGHLDVGSGVARLAPGEEDPSAGTVTPVGRAGEGPRERDHRRHTAQLLHGRAGADIDGGIFNEDITNTEEAPYRGGLLRSSSYALSTAAGMVGVTAGGRPDAFTDVFYVERRGQHPAGGRAAEALFPDEACGAPHGHATLHGRFQRLLHLGDVLRPGRGAGGGSSSCVRFAHLQRLQHLGGRAHQAVWASVLGERSRPQLRRARGAGRGHRGRHRHPCGLLIGLPGALPLSPRLGRHLPAGRVGGECPSAWP